METTANCQRRLWTTHSIRHSSELAQIYAGLVRDKNDDWIWDAMIRNPDLVGGFNRLDSTILKAGNGKVIAKEGADGLLGMAIEHRTIQMGWEL